MNIVPDGVHRTRIYGGSDGGQRWTAHDVIDVVLRRGRLVLASLGVCLALAVFYLATTPDSFTAVAVLIMDTKQTPPSPSQVSQEPLIDPAIIESQIEILKSERIAQQAVDRLHLGDDPQFAGGGPGLRSRFLSWLSGQAIPQPTAEMRRANAVDSLLHKMKVTRTGHTYLAEIAVTSLDPVRSADVANTVAEAYIQDQLDSRLQSNQRTVTWMNRRVEEVKAQADAAAMTLAEYRQTHAAEIGAQDAGITAKIRDLSAVAEATRNDYEALQNRALRLTQFIQQQSLPITEARVLTDAKPPLSKSAPKTQVILLLAGVGGLVIGAGLVLLRETLDRKLRWPRQVKSILGLPLAGAIPTVKTRRGARGGQALASLFDSRRPWCAATETLRFIKVSVDHSVRRRGGVVVGIASPWPGEGKSTLTLNMAVMLAEVGARVLVVDADLKKPDLSAALASGSELGLVDLIDGDATLDRCLVGTKSGFDLLGRGRRDAPLHPFDVLGSRRMQGALTGAQANYDYVLVDLPALLTSVDSQAVARFVDTFVIVTEFGRTTIDDVERALATSETVANRIVAIVLNKARGGDRGLQRRVLRRARSHSPAFSA